MAEGWGLDPVLTSVAERKARKRRIVKSRQPAAVVQARATRPVARQREKTGLAWLFSKGKVNTDQYRAGLRIGRDWRTCQVNGVAPVKSCLESLGMPGGGDPTAPAMNRTEYDLSASRALTGALAAIQDSPDLMFAVEQIACRDRTHLEVIAMTGGTWRDGDRLIANLRSALDLLIGHYRRARSAA